MKKSILTAGLLLAIGCFALTASFAADTTVTIGNFANNADGWFLGGEGSSPKTLERVAKDGRYYLKGTLSATSTTQGDTGYPYDGYLLMGTGWDATNQAAQFVTSQPVSLVFDTATWVSEEPWYWEIQAAFAAEINSPWHATAMYWAPQTITLTAANFGVTNEVFASMTSFQIALTERASERSWDGKRENPSASIGIDNVRLVGTAAVPEPGTLSTLLLGLCGVGGFYFRKRNS